MGVRVDQYAREFERNVKKSGLEKAHKKAVKASKVKGVVKPTSAEQKIITRRLKKRYPQMYTKNWAQRLKGKVKKHFKTERTKQVESRLTRAGLTPAEIAKLRGKK